MTRRRVSKAAGWVNSRDLPKGPGGRNLCRWCQQEVGKGRRTFCSDACVHEHKIRSNPGYVRDKVFERDAGICAKCGADTEALKHALHKARRDFPSYFRGIDWDQRRKEAFDKSGIPEQFRGLELSRSWWEADHVVPVIEGGGECGLDGYRTLCVPCHKQETRELRQRLAQVRKARQDAPGATQTKTPTQDPQEASKTQGRASSASQRGRIQRTPVHTTPVGGELAGVSSVRRQTGGEARVPSVPEVRKDHGR